MSELEDELDPWKQFQREVYYEELKQRRQADNFVYYIGKIAKHKYPNIKPWQEAIVTHAERGLLNTFTYEEARKYYHTKIKGEEQ